MGTCTSANSRIVPDRPTKTVFKLDYDALQTLNSQSAFNEHQLAKARECGCFHCGSCFPPSWITDWMSELLGERTGLCPFCGRDALVLGTTSHPLSTALLSCLYEHYFSEELRRRLQGIPIAPDYREATFEGDGVIFQICQAPSGSVDLGTIDLWGLGFGGATPWGRRGHFPGGILSARPSTFCEDDQQFTEIAFFDSLGITTSFEPYNAEEMDRVKKLYETYGDRLRLSIVDKHPSTAKGHLFALPSPD